MNFEQFSIKLFKVGFDYYPRTYYVLVKRNGLVRVVSVLTGEILFDNINPNEVFINGILMSNVEQLQDVVFSRNCVCDGDNIIPEPFKYFDLSFDETFE